jgi:hypothetical protein
MASMSFMVTRPCGPVAAGLASPCPGDTIRRGQMGDAALPAESQSGFCVVRLGR